VVAVARPTALGSLSIGPGPAATGLASLLLLLFAGLSQRASHRRESRGQARYRALINKSSDLVLVVNRQGRATYVSPSVERLLASQDHDGRTSPRTASDPGLVDFVAALDPADRPGFSTILAGAARGDMSTGEFRVNGGNGTATFEMTVQDLTDDPSVAGLVLTGRDITDRLVLQAEMERRALHDELTGLPNRSLLADRFAQALRIDARDGTRTGLLLLDLDRFKEVNDTFGHHYGDELLRQVGPRLAGALRGVDTVARLGGDEFAVLLPDVCRVDDAIGVARTLSTALSRPFQVNDVALDVGVSIGVVVSGEHGQDVATLLQHADIAMYVAKRQHLAVSAYDPTPMSTPSAGSGRSGSHVGR